ncbi:MAG: hypothetical protein DYG88_02860 [Chloroflexi bacterium CFX4]|nr:hypothetical protein [Chloroflexi bacterium CFX4]MDL1922593.1 XisI protein [Chloroflexi bacterium CFX3]
MASLAEIVQQAVSDYAGEAGNGQLYMTVSPDGSLFTVIGIGALAGQRFITVGLVARLAGDLVVIERDQNDKPLVEALLQAGIPRKQIILAYAGEPVPESA